MKKFVFAFIAVLALAKGAFAYTLAPDGSLTLTNGSDPLEGLDRSAVRTVTVAEGVTLLGEGVLEGCNAMEEIALPQSLTEIGPRALADCASLTYVKLPEGFTAVGSEAFKGCSFMKSAIIPASTAYIADNAFSSPVKIYGYSGSYAEAYAKRRVYRLTSLGTEDVIKDRFSFESIDGCDINSIEVYRSGTPRINFFRGNTADSPITDIVGWLSQPDVYGIITVLCNNEFFWTDREGVRFDSYFEARDAHRTNQYSFTPDYINMCNGIAGVEYDCMSGFRGGLAIVGRDGMYGVADTAGQPVVELNFPTATTIGGEVFLVNNGKFYSRTMNCLPDGTWLDTDYCFGGRFMLRSSNGCFGFADRDLNVIIPPRYNRIPWGATYPFYSNSEIVCLAINEKLILVDKNGNEILYFN